MRTSVTQSTQQKNKGVYPMFSDEMMQVLSKYPNGTLLRFCWDYGALVIDGTIDTIYETDNSADENSKEYQEFYACAVQIKRIIENTTNKFLIVNSLVEVSINNQPTSIELPNGAVIWSISVCH